MSVLQCVVSVLVKNAKKVTITITDKAGLDISGI